MTVGLGILAVSLADTDNNPGVNQLISELRYEELGEEIRDKSGSNPSILCGLMSRKRVLRLSNPQCNEKKKKKVLQSVWRRGKRGKQRGGHSFKGNKGKDKENFLIMYCLVRWA